jgi:hypothetical protein
MPSLIESEKSGDKKRDSEEDREDAIKALEESQVSLARLRKVKKTRSN